MTINIDRLKHSLAVACKMQRLALCYFDKYSGLHELDPDEMFILGMLHDIGYQFCDTPSGDTPSDHAERGGLLLRSQGYKYWKEVYYHGIPQHEYDSPELWLLNYADMTTGPCGEDMTVQEWINDISKRYGKDSIRTRNALKLSAMLIDF